MSPLTTVSNTPIGPLVGIGLTTFHAPLRLRRLLEVLDAQGQLRLAPLRVFEDPWKPDDQPVYRKVCSEYNVPYNPLPQWSCMQGCIQAAVAGTPEPWFLYLTDDVLPTPGSIENLLSWATRLDSTPVAAIQIPYWNYDDLPAWARPFSEKDRIWSEPTDWLAGIPHNPHWNYHGRPRPYVNVNGAGFLLRRSTWAAVGGFSQQTWCLDEDIAAKIWLRTDGHIVTVPGPPFVHHMGGSLDHPPHTFHSEAAWLAAGWPPKTQLDSQLRAAMASKCGDEATYDPYNRTIEGIAV